MNRLNIVISYSILIVLYPGIVSGQPSAIETARQIQPSIVSVHAVQFNIMEKSDKMIHDPLSGKIIEDPKAIHARMERAGAGVVLSSEGLIITNFHTIQGADRLTVQLYDHQPLNADIIQVSPQEDLALIKVGKQLPLVPITLADSNRLTVGDTVLHIGHSFLLDGTISQGRITGLGTSLKAKKQGQHEIAVIRVNLNLYQGDSGGPLLNQQGQLIGMTTAKDVTKNLTSYAIPANKIKNILLNYPE